jgi:hypothetical protein
MPVSPTVRFIAALAEGRCLSFDRDGEAKLTLIVSQTEAVKLAANLDALMGTSFRVVLTPEKAK